MINFIIVMHDFINTFFFVLLEVLIFFYNYFIRYSAPVVIEFLYLSV